MSASMGRSIIPPSIDPSVMRPLEARSVIGRKHPRDPALADWFGGAATWSGARVSADTIMRIVTVYACISWRARQMASVPLVVNRKLPGGASERDPSHPLYKLLHDRPNARQTSFQWRMQAEAHICIRGNAYSEIVTNGGGVPVALEPLSPDWVRMQSELVNGKVAYEIRQPGKPLRILMQGEILHLTGLITGADGITGLSPLDVHRETFGTVLAMEELFARTMENGARPLGAVKVKELLDDEASELLRKSIERLHKGLRNAGRVAILDGGMEWDPLSLDFTELQFIDKANLSRRDIAAIYGVPPHKVGDLERATFTNIESQVIEVVTDLVLPECVSWEQRMSADLLTDAGRETHKIVFVLDGILRGDTPSRYAAYAVGRQWGWLSANDVRRLENMNPLAEGGDVYLSPVNMTPADRLASAIKDVVTPPAPPEPPAPPPKQE
jgi:HK97 family phage portal protein